MIPPYGAEAAEWRHYRFGLIVTGETEEHCLPDLFRVLASQGNCSFTVIRRIGQRSPIKSARRKRKMVGTGKTIPNRDAEQIGFPARRFLSLAGDFVMLVDDLEASRSEDVKEVFSRYRLALDTILGERMSAQAAVHFLVNMLEAYYFADANAVNQVLNTDLEDFDGDVETIRHPKNKLKSIFAGFDEKEHGPLIVRSLDVRHVLAHEERCASLRTMFEWASVAIHKTSWLPKGRLFDTTKRQIETVRKSLR